MSETIITLQPSTPTLVPAPARQGSYLSGSWTASYWSNGYTLMTDAGGTGNAIIELLFGQGTDDLLISSPTYNNPAEFGGQTTPNTAWLSPAQDDSWAPRYQVAGGYQTTTYVPTQNKPLMTHIYGKGTEGAPLGIWRIDRVIDKDNFVIFDPQQGMPAGPSDPETFIPICQNMFPATKVVFSFSEAFNGTIYYATGFGDIYGPTTFDVGPGTNGIVEPMVVVWAGTNPAAAIVTQ